MMQNQDYFELSLEFFEIAESIQALIKESFGVDIKIYSSIDQIIEANPEQLQRYLEALKSRLGAYLSVIVDKNPAILTRLDNISKQLHYFGKQKIDNSAVLLGGKREIVEAICEDLISISKIINGFGYKVVPFRRKSLVRYFNSDVKNLRKIRERVALQLKIYKCLAG